MNRNQKVWYISAVIVLACLLIAALIYVYTGQLFLLIFVAPPLVHYYLKKRSRNNEY
jgi:hypothetical protein